MRTPDLDALALACLRELALSGRGYFCLGAHGWALREDVERLIRRGIPERLPILYKRGSLMRRDVRPPAFTKPTWIFRINEAGARRAAELWGVPDVQLPEVDARASHDSDIHIPAPSRRALELLRLAAHDPESRQVEGRGGWRTMSELLATTEMERDEFDIHPDTWEPDPDGWRGQAGSDDAWRGEHWQPDFSTDSGPSWDPFHGGMPREFGPDDIRFDRADVHWLLSARLAELRRVSVPEQRRPVTFYRATEMGLSARLLDWSGG